MTDVIINSPFERRRGGGLAAGLKRRGLLDEIPTGYMERPSRVRQPRTVSRVPLDPPAGAAFPDAPAGAGSPQSAAPLRVSPLAARLNADGPIRNRRQAGPTANPFAPAADRAVGFGSAAAATAPSLEPGEGGPQERHLEVVGPRRRSAADQQRRTRLLVALGTIAGTLVVFGLVYLHVISTEKQFTIDKLSTKETQLEQVYQQERLQADRDASPKSIYNKATTQLGMVEPSSVQAVRAPRGSATPSPSDPTPKNGATAPSGASDWPAVESQTGGGS